MSVSGSEREVRGATNQSLFRAGNERLKKFNEDWFGTVRPRGGWVCECANDTCLDHIEMTSIEYEAVRQDGAHFFVSPDDEHVWPDNRARDRAPRTLLGRGDDRSRARHSQARRPALDGRAVIRDVTFGEIDERPPSDDSERLDPERLAALGELRAISAISESDYTRETSSAGEEPHVSQASTRRSLSFIRRLRRRLSNGEDTPLHR
jgi:hypothetical protein